MNVVHIGLFSAKQFVNCHHLGCRAFSYTQSIQLKIEKPIHELHFNCESWDKPRHNRIRYFTCASNKTHSALSRTPHRPPLLPNPVLGVSNYILVPPFNAILMALTSFEYKTMLFLLKRIQAAIKVWEKAISAVGRLLHTSGGENISAFRSGPRFAESTLAISNYYINVRQMVLGSV